MAWMEPAGTSTTSPHETSRQAIRSTIDPSAMASRNCCDVSRRSSPRAIRPPGSADITYHASDLPRTSPIDRAKASPGCTWIDSGSRVNSSFRSSVGSWAAGSVRSYQISPILPCLPAASLHGRRSVRPQGFSTARVEANSIVMGASSFAPPKAGRHVGQLRQSPKAWPRASPARHGNCACVGSAPIWRVSLIGTRTCCGQALLAWWAPVHVLSAYRYE